MARPKGSSNKSNAQKPTIKVPQDTLDNVKQNNPSLSEEFIDSAVQDLEKVLNNINETVEGVSEVVEQSIVEETQEVSNEEQAPLESSTIENTTSEVSSPSEEASIAQNESESVTEGSTEDTPAVEEKLPVNMVVKVASQGGNVVIRGQHLGTVVSQMLAEAYKGAEFGKSFPKLHKKPYVVVLDTPEANYNHETIVPVYDPTKEYYEATVSSSDPVVFTKALLALGKDGAVVNLKAFGKPLGRRLQIKVFSRTPIDKSAFVHTYAHTPIKYTQEELESCYDSPLSRIGEQYGLTETKRDDLIKAVLKEQDK